MITQGLVNSFLTELAAATHALATDTLKIALYTGNATLGPTTTAYSATNEVSGTGYSAGGVALTHVTVNADANGMYVSFDNPTWPSSSFTCRGALIYNSSKANKAIAVLNFGSDKTAGPNFTINLPANTSTTALLRLQY